MFEMPKARFFFMLEVIRGPGKLFNIGTVEDFAIYQKLESNDLVVVKDITTAKQYGQGSNCLAWFWRIGPNEDEITGEWMEECEPTLF